MTIVFEIAKATKTKSKQFSTNYLMGFFYVFMRNRRRYGGLLIHLGVVLMFIGFAGRFLDVEKDIVLQPNETAIIGSYELKFRGVESFQEQNVTHRAARIEVWQEGEQVDVLLPSKSFYPTQPNPLTEVAIRRTFWEDLYLIFTNENRQTNLLPSKFMSILLSAGHGCLYPCLRLEWAFAFPIVQKP